MLMIVGCEVSEVRQGGETRSHVEWWREKGVDFSAGLTGVQGDPSVAPYVDS